MSTLQRAIEIATQAHQGRQGRPGLYRTPAPCHGDGQDRG